MWVWTTHVKWIEYNLRYPTMHSCIYLVECLIDSVNRHLAKGNNKNDIVGEGFFWGGVKSSSPLDVLETERQNVRWAASRSHQVMWCDDYSTGWLSCGAYLILWNICDIRRRYRNLHTLCGWLNFFSFLFFSIFLTKENRA